MSSTNARNVVGLSTADASPTPEQRTEYNNAIKAFRSILAVGPRASIDGTLSALNSMKKIYQLAEYNLRFYN